MSEGVIYYHLSQITPIMFRIAGAGKEKSIELHKPKNGYTEGNLAVSPFYHEGGQTATETGTFTRRIGNTVYRVNVISSSTKSETMPLKKWRRQKTHSLCGK